MGILIVLLGIAVPMVGSALDRRRVTSVAEEIVGALLMARAHAQAEGVTVEVILSGDADPRTSSKLIAREIDLHAPPFEDEPGPPPLPRGWAYVDIDRTMTLRVVTADEADDDADQFGLDDGRGGADASAAPARRRVVVFAADGSGLVAPRLRISDAEGRSVDIVINPVTGLPRIDADPAVLSAIPVPLDDEDPERSGVGER